MGLQNTRVQALAVRIEQSNASLGANAALMGAVVTQMASEVPVAWDDVDTATARLTRAVADLPGSGDSATRMTRLRDDLREHADHVHPGMAAAVASLLTDMDGDLTLHVAMAAQEPVRTMLEVAVLWPGLFGNHPSPFTPAVELAAMGVMSGVEGTEVVLHHNHLVRVAPVPPPAPPPPRLTIVRNVEL